MLKGVIEAMNRIKGLLFKDFAQLRSYKRNIIIMLILYLVGMLPSTLEDGLNVTSQAMIILVFGVIGITTFNYDETSKTDRFLLTMPLTKNEIVFEKYLLSATTTFIGAIITFIVSFVINFATSKSFTFLLPLVVSITGALLGVSILVSFQIPCIYRWGAEKGRIQAMILMAVSIGILAAAGVIFGNNIVANISINQSEFNIFYVLPILFLACTCFVYWVSYCFSLKQFRKREV